MSNVRLKELLDTKCTFIRLYVHLISKTWKWCFTESYSSISQPSLCRTSSTMKHKSPFWYIFGSCRDSNKECIKSASPSLPITEVSAGHVQNSKWRFGFLREGKLHPYTPHVWLTRASKAKLHYLFRGYLYQAFKYMLFNNHDLPWVFSSML